MPQELLKAWKELNTHTNVSGVSAWANVRSALDYLPEMCGDALTGGKTNRRLPVFISNNMEDRLFKGDAVSVLAPPPRKTQGVATDG